MPGVTRRPEPTLCGWIPACAGMTEGEGEYNLIPQAVKEEYVRLLKIHRVLIGSGIAVCLLLSIRHGFLYVHSGNLGALLRAVGTVIVAAVLGWYLYSIRTQ